MAEPRLAKTIAIGLGAIEFLFGLVAAFAMILAALWVEADPTIPDQVLFWPVFGMTILALVIGPPFVAYLAERATTPRTVYICLAVLVIYPLALIGWANLDAA